MNFELYSLPWATLLPLAAGYAGYYVSTLGFKAHHRTIDITFSTILFGVLAAWAYTLIMWITRFEPLASVVAFAAAISAGAWWTKSGRKAFARFLREKDIAHSDDLPSAWASLISTDTSATQLSVKLRDGTWLKCNRLKRFDDAPNGACVLGYSGDLLMYITHAKSPGEDQFEECDGVTDDQWGAEITYIPSDQIARVDLRRI